MGSGGGGDGGKDEDMLPLGYAQQDNLTWSIITSELWQLVISTFDKWETRQYDCNVDCIVGGTRFFILVSSN